MGSGGGRGRRRGDAAGDAPEDHRPGTLWLVGRSGARDPLDGPATGRRERRPKPPAVTLLSRGPGWVAVSKPAGLATTRERWFPEAPTVLDLVHGLLRRDDPAAAPPRPVHRLDRSTTGVVLFALEGATAAALSRAFRRRRMEKEYLALVVGSPPEPAGEIDLRLQREKGPRGLVRVVRHRGKPSRTAWATEEAFAGWTLLRVFPRSGRTHQVRATLSHLGCPIVGDEGYGGGEGLYLSALKPGYRAPRDHPERPLLGRVALHAGRIALSDRGAGPGVAPLLDVSCPLPRDLRVAIENLRRFRPPAAGAAIPAGDR